MEAPPAGRAARREIMSARGLEVYVALLSEVLLSIAYARRIRYTARKPGLLGFAADKTQPGSDRAITGLSCARGVSPKRSERAR
jgi:hypothetical protein